jgi:hypothetical protein
MAGFEQAQTGMCLLALTCHGALSQMLNVCGSMPSRTPYRSGNILVSGRRVSAPHSMVETLVAAWRHLPLDWSAQHALFGAC